MNRSLAGMVTIALLLIGFGSAFGQGYYGGYGAPSQGAPYGSYGQGYAMPGQGQAAPGHDPGYQSPPAASYSANPYQAPQMGASPYGSPAQQPYPQAAQTYQPYAQPQYAPPAQYPQSAPGNYYTEYPQAAGQPGQEAAVPEGYYQPGALIQNEIYWDPSYDRVMNGNGGQAVQMQPQAPQQPVAAQARAAAPEQRAVRRNAAPKRAQTVSNRKQTTETPAQSRKTEKPSLRWGKGVQAEKQSTEQNTAFRWGQGTSSQAAPNEAAPSRQPREQVRHRAPQADAQSSAPGRLPWGSN